MQLLRIRGGSHSSFLCFGLLDNELSKLKHLPSRSALRPADGAAPLLTTISDLIGIALLCGIATSMVP